jgi:hypothetical protein
LASGDPPVANPKDSKDAADPYYRLQSNIREVEAAVYGSDTATATLRDRLNKLVGYRVGIEGDLFPATSGYDRTSVMLRVQGVNAIDASGRQALLKPKPVIKVSDFDVYDVTVNAGKRLVIRAHEGGSTAPLVPSEPIPHTLDDQLGSALCRLPRWL